MVSPLTCNLERVACVTLYLKSSALELTIYRRNSSYRTFWELILKIKNSARSSPWEEFNEEQVLSTKAECQLWFTDLGKDIVSPHVLVCPEKSQLGLVTSSPRPPFIRRVPFWTVYCTVTLQRGVHMLRLYFSPLGDMVEPKEKGYFYKLRGAPFCRRGILPAFSIQRLSAPSLWVGNVRTDYFIMPFLVYVTVLVSKTHWGTLPFLESHGLLPLHDALMYFHAI